MKNHQKGGLIMEVKNTLVMIEDVVRRAGSLEEACQLIAAEMAKPGYFILSQSIIEQKIASLWQGKERARERKLERLKEGYGGTT